MDEAFETTVRALDNLLLGAQNALWLPRPATHSVTQSATQSDAQTRAITIKAKTDETMALCNKLPEALSAGRKHVTHSDGTPHRGHVVVNGTKGTLEDAVPIFMWSSMITARTLL